MIIVNLLVLWAFKNLIFFHVYFHVIDIQFHVISNLSCIICIDSLKTNFSQLYYLHITGIETDVKCRHADVTLECIVIFHYFNLSAYLICSAAVSVSCMLYYILCFICVQFVGNKFSSYWWYQSTRIYLSLHAFSLLSLFASSRWQLKKSPLLKRKSLPRKLNREWLPPKKPNNAKLPHCWGL